MGETFAHMVLGRSAALGGKPALIVPGVRTISHADLLARVEARAGGLRALDLPTGSRVMLRLGNEPDFPITFFAATKTNGRCHTS